MPEIAPQPPAFPHISFTRETKNTERLTQMAHLQTVSLEHLPENHTFHIALFRNVKNAAFLHQQLLAGNTDFEYALIDASIVSPTNIM